MLGVLPTAETVVAERFFDEAGGMQLVVHAPFGGRITVRKVQPGQTLRFRYRLLVHPGATDKIADEHKRYLAEVK